MKYCSSCQASYPLDYTACPKDQTALQLVTDLLPGLVLRGKYEIIEKLGAGGMGAVYKARHLAFGELRAIKFVSSHLLADERALARFRAEAVVARRLQHANAVKVEDLDTTDDGRPFIVMEYVEGRSLRQLFTDEREVTTKRILALARQACAALAAAHALGIVHRDIKPDNLMILGAGSANEILKVADFGLAKVREGFDLAPNNAFTQTGFILGTPTYMSPEQASGVDVDGRSDLYSLGVVLYQLLTGRLPFHSDTPFGMLIHHRETPPPSPAALGVPHPLAEFLLKALAKRREDRFKTAEQMDEALRLLSLMPLPEFVGQGIQEGFDPHWAGSRHASRVTTLHGSGPPKPNPSDRSGAQRKTVGPTRVLSSPNPPSKSVSSPIEDAAPESSSSQFWIGIGAAALIGVWLLTNRSQPDPPPSRTAPPQAVIEAPQVVAPQPELHAEPERAPDRTDSSLRFEIERLLGDSTALRNANIRVEVANGVATLVGEAPSQTGAQLAASLASSVPGVRQVFTTLQVSGAVQGESIVASTPAATTAAPVAEPLPPPPARAEDSTREQVRILLDRAREKMEARNPAGAEADLQAVLRLDPTNAVAKDALERLKNRPPPGGRPPGPRPTP